MKGISPSSYRRFTLIVAIVLTVIFTAWKIYEYSQDPVIDHFDFIYPTSSSSKELVPSHNENSHITFVTAYYTIPNKYNKKKKENVYLEWITNYIGFANQVPLIVFSTGKDLEQLQIIAKNAKHIHFVDLPMNQFLTYQYRISLEQQKQIDPEKDIHTLELYMIWNEKPYFVKRAMDLNVFNSTHYCWIDIGVVRDSRLSNVMMQFPQPSSLDYFHRIDKICFVLMEPKNLSKFKSTDELGISIVNKTPHQFVSVAGCFMFGRKENWNIFIERYYRLFELYIQQGVFVGKDQNLMTNVISNHIDDFVLFDVSKIKTWLNPYQKDPWLSIIDLFSGLEKTRPEHTPILMGGLGNQLFQVASIYGVARKKGHVFVLDSDVNGSSPHSSQDYSKTIFKRFLQKEESTNPLTSVSHFIKSKFSTYTEPNSHFYDLKLMNSRSDYSKYSGYFQNYNYFDSYLDEIRQLFDLPVVPETQRFFIHIRLGDYVNNKNHYVDLKKYYQTCIDIVRRQYGDQVEFCIMTNDKKLAEQYILEHLPLIRRYTFGDSDELVALSEMSQCALGGICANSTFSWWGGVLNPRKTKKVFFPKRIYPDTSNYKDYDIKGMFHPGFMIIETD